MRRGLDQRATGRNPRGRVVRVDPQPVRRYVGDRQQEGAMDRDAPLSRAEEREARLKAQLKANMGRRKAQKRERDTVGSVDSETSDE